MAMKKVFFFLLAFLGVLACDKDAEEEIVAVSSVSISPPSAELTIGKTLQLTASVLPADAADKSVTWASLAPSVATVSASGLVTAIAEGVATIKARAGDKEGSCQVTVKKEADPVVTIVAVESIALNKTELSLEPGQSETLTATVLPENATDKTVTWATSNGQVATVENGKVTAVTEGEAVITAKAGDKEATCKVTVKMGVVAVESVSLNKKELSLEPGQSETLTTTVLPENATDKTVTWATSNAQVATVENGKVTAIAEGEAVITAKAGEKEATCKVTVKMGVVAVESVSLNKTELSLELGQSETLTATVLPENATDKTVTWTTSNAQVATVENGKVTAVNEGEAIITAKAGEKEATCKVIVKKKVIEVESISLNKTELSLEPGKSEILTAIVLPENATDKTVTWATSNAQVAMVENGKVTAVKEGEAVITAKAGGKEATCKVKVKKDDGVGSGGSEGFGFENWN